MDWLPLQPEYIQGMSKAEPGWQVTSRGDSQSCLERRSPREWRGARAGASKCGSAGKGSGQDCRWWRELLTSRNHRISGWRTRTGRDRRRRVAALLLEGGAVPGERFESCRQPGSIPGRDGLEAGGGKQRLPGCVTEPRQQLRTKSRVVLLGGCLDEGLKRLKFLSCFAQPGRTLKTLLVPISR